MRTLLKDGAEAVTLRELAKREGVSPRAPYRHFEDRQALLAALAEEGFERLQRALLEARPGRGRTPLHALGHAYVDFAIANPRLLQLMFSDFPDRARRHPSLHARALATFEVLVRSVPGAKASVAAIGWAFVHGLGTLLGHGSFDHVLPSARARSRLVDQAVAVFARGAVRSAVTSPERSG